MDDILKSVVKLTKLCNEVPVNQELQSKKNILQVDQLEDHSTKKEVKKEVKSHCSQIFNQIVNVNKFVNPVDSKAFDELK